MKVLIIDYEDARLVTTTIPDNVTDVKSYILGTLGFKDSTTDFVTTNDDHFPVFDLQDNITPYARI